jgi:Predicted metal-dependent hydrolase
MELNGIEIAVERKDIKNLHLAVYPPDARVHVSSPKYLDDNDVRSFIISKWEWIEEKRKEVLEQARQTERNYVTGETYYHFGQHYRLRVDEKSRCSHSITKQGDWLIMTVQPGTTTEHRAEVLKEWQRSELKFLLSDLVPQWSDKMEETNVTWEVKQMRSQWGSCISKKRHLIFNLELARVPRSCIDYVVAHELTHLKVANHNKMFEAILTYHFPQWKLRRKELNDFIALPLEDAQKVTGTHNNHF